MAKIDFAKTLNEQQLEAVTHADGPQLVIAGAGSGKTRVITYRIAWLVQERGVDPGHIAAVTFTNKAAAEMKERVEELLGLYPLPTFVGTFHRFALRLLRAYSNRVGLKPDFVILDTRDQQSLVKKAIKAENLEGSFQPQAVLSAISSAKNKLLGPVEYEQQADDFFSTRVARLYRRYQQMLRENSGVDFDDMIRFAVRLLSQEEDIRERLRRRTRYLMVDEFQDTNHAQLRLIHELADASGNLTAVGDEDQGIYRWRGAELGNILNFEDNFPGAEIRKLERNYRSTQNILDASGVVVGHNRKRRGKTLWTDSGDGAKLQLYRARDELDEARWVVQTLRGQETEHPLSQMAVLVRTNAQTRALEDEFLRQRMPYSLVGGLRFYERAEVKDLIAYLRLLRNPNDLLSFNRVLNTPPRGIGKTTHDLLLKLARDRDQTPWETLEEGQLEGIPARGAKALLRFRDLLQEVRGEADALPLPALLRRVLEATSYTDIYNKGDDESQAKLENVGEFLSAVQEFTEANTYGGSDDLLTAFLDHASLISDLDGWSSAKGVSLMTLHSAKGLEFASVVVVGLEDGLLPHFNSQAHEDDIEEERRLLYVGMTRAEERLFLTCCGRRRIAGRYQDQRPSPFLAEIPDSHLETENSPELFRSDSTSGVYAFFGRSRPETSRSASASFGTAAPRREVFRETVVEDGALRKGTRVRHASLGRGVIIDLEGGGDNARLTVLFEGIGKRKLMARYANLELV